MSDDRITAIEAAPDAPESLRERVAEAILEAWYPDPFSSARVFMGPDDWEQFQRAAGAALEVICTPALNPAPPDSEPAS